MWPTRRLPALSAALGAAALLGCVEHSLYERMRPRDYAIPAPPPAHPASEGAIWRGDTASGSFLFFDRKARGVGDLVTVVITENARAIGRANTSLEKESSFGASLLSDIGFTDLLQDAAMEVMSLFEITQTGERQAAGESVTVVESQQNSGFEGDGETARSGAFTGIVTCRVVDVLPGGVFHIYGRRQIVVNHEAQLITVEGLVRREDISIHNSVPSTALADAQLTYDGIGVLDDKQRPSLLARVMDWIYPF